MIEQVAALKKQNKTYNLRFFELFFLKILFSFSIPSFTLPRDSRAMKSFISLKATVASSDVESGLFTTNTRSSLISGVGIDQSDIATKKRERERERVFSFR